MAGVTAEHSVSSDKGVSTSAKSQLPRDNDQVTPLKPSGGAQTTSQHAAQSQAGKKTKGKKSADPIKTSKQIEDTIAQLERNKAGEKDQEVEIEREVKKANRELTNLLSTFETPLSRIEMVQRKYSELLADMKKTERDHLKAKKRADQLQKEKDSSRSELTKANTIKDKLEKLCRELQRENKKLKDENKRLLEKETTMQDQLHGRLENVMYDMQEFADEKENPDNASANLEIDEIFRQKFKSFIDQYELRELQFHSLLRTKELEVQYQMARYEQQRKAQEQEASKSRQLTSQVSTFSQTETELRNQLNVYVEKFKQVEDTLNNSNDLFLTFRKEMEEMSKKTKRLEKENNTLTRKHDQTNQNILQMAEERTKANKELEVLRKKNENLEKLCRGMQAQGRGQAPNIDVAELPLEDEVTDSDYQFEDEDDDDEEDEGGDDGELEKPASRELKGPPKFGPEPPPPPVQSQNSSHSAKLVRQVNGVKH